MKKHKSSFSIEVDKVDQSNEVDKNKVEYIFTLDIKEEDNPQGDATIALVEEEARELLNVLEKYLK